MAEVITIIWLASVVAASILVSDTLSHLRFDRATEPKPTEEPHDNH